MAEPSRASEAGQQAGTVAPSAPPSPMKPRPTSHHSCPWALCKAPVSGLGSPGESDSPLPPLQPGWARQRRGGKGGEPPAPRWAALVHSVYSPKFPSNYKRKLLSLEHYLETAAGGRGGGRSRLRPMLLVRGGGGPAVHGFLQAPGSCLWGALLWVPPSHPCRMVSHPGLLSCKKSWCRGRWGTDAAKAECGCPARHPRGASLIMSLVTPESPAPMRTGPEAWGGRQGPGPPGSLACHVAWHRAALGPS